MILYHRTFNKRKSFVRNNKKYGTFHIKLWFSVVDIKIEMDTSFEMPINASIGENPSPKTQGGKYSCHRDIFVENWCSIALHAWLVAFHA
jgi:hypothetical protein